MGKKRGKKLNCILVVDLECTCWKGPPPTGQLNEIIEVGISTVDTKSFEITGGESIIVKPVFSEISEFCTQLTTLTSEYVNKYGINFAQACSILTNKYNSHSNIWGSFGDFDRHQTESQCMVMGQKYPFNSRHMNIKTLAGLFLKLDNEEGMIRICKRMGIDVVGTHHRGFDDSQNIAKILVTLLKLGEHFRYERI